MRSNLKDLETYVYKETYNIRTEVLAKYIIILRSYYNKKNSLYLYPNYKRLWIGKDVPWATDEIFHNI